MYPDEQDVTASFNTSFVAGSTGETLKLNADQTLTGANCQVVIVNPNGLRYVLPATVDASGAFAILTTGPNTFPYPGTYEVMLQEVIATTPVSYNNSAPITVNVIAGI